MSMPVVQQPPAGIYSQQAAAHSSPQSGSYGMLLVVLAVITILGVVARMLVSCLCARRELRGGNEYGFNDWVERKCSTCIDGPLDSQRGGDYDLIPIGGSAENGD